MLSIPLSFSLQASSSSWLAKICRSSSLTRQAMDTGVVLGQSARADTLWGSGSWKVQTIQNTWLLKATNKKLLFCFGLQRSMEWGVRSYLCKSSILSFGCGCVPYRCGHGKQSGGWNEKRCGQVVHGVAVQPILQLLQAPKTTQGWQFRNNSNFCAVCQINNQSLKLEMCLWWDYLLNIFHDGVHCKHKLSMRWHQKRQSCSCTFCFPFSPPLNSGELCGPEALVRWECVWCPAGLPQLREAPPNCGTISVWRTSWWVWHKQRHLPLGWKRGRK